MKKKVLIIEDNETNMYLMKYILRKRGCTVIGKRSGEAGIQSALHENPDLILMDIQLPGMDGLETTKKIRENLSTVPIVAVTSYAMTGDRGKAIAAGCDGYTEKPINPDTFIIEIEKFIV